METTSSGNAAIIALFEVFVSFLFFRVFRGEKLSFDHALGCALMVLGAIIVLLPNVSGVHVGDFFVLGATFFAPAGNFFQQRARVIASAESIMFLRSFFSLPAIFALAYLIGQRADSASISASALYLLANGILLLGLSKLFWIESIHRISVTKSNALSSVSHLLTLLVAWLMLAQEPTILQLSSFVPFIAGVLLLTDRLQLTRS